MMTRDDWGRVAWDAFNASPVDDHAGCRIAEAVLCAAETEAAQLVKDRARAVSFIKSDAWELMNERRAYLIDRDVRGKDSGLPFLSETERAELATLDTAVDIIVSIAHPQPFDKLDKHWETMYRVVDGENKRLKEDRRRLVFAALSIYRGSASLEETLDRMVNVMNCGDFLNNSSLSGMLPDIDKALADHDAEAQRCK